MFHVMLRAVVGTLLALRGDAFSSPVFPLGDRISSSRMPPRWPGDYCRRLGCPWSCHGTCDAAPHRSFALGQKCRWGNSCWCHPWPAPECLSHGLYSVRRYQIELIVISRIGRSMEVSGTFSSIHHESCEREGLRAGQINHKRDGWRGRREAFWGSNGKKVCGKALDHGRFACHVTSSGQQRPAETSRKQQRPAMTSSD